MAERRLMAASGCVRRSDCQAGFDAGGALRAAKAPSPEPGFK
jgi:hypothetical protein